MQRTIPSDGDDARRRAERRAFIRAAHPDAGGDPERFVAGLAHFDGPAAGTARPGQAPGVHRSRRPDRLVRHGLRVLRRRLRGLPARRLL